MDLIVKAPENKLKYSKVIFLLKPVKLYFSTFNELKERDKGLAQW